MKPFQAFGAPLLAALATTVHAAPARPLSEAELAAYFDEAAPRLLKDADVAGASVVVVVDGRVAFARGYGFADVAARKPFTPDTLLRPGSISKLFTWTAVMQQAEQGRLDLDTDVNRYLDFRVPPVTLRQLMTHTGGFEETTKDLFVSRPRDLYPIRDYLVRRRPEQIYPPGKVVAYSNWGTALAGYVVTRVSGEPIEAYVERHVLAPLGMRRTTLAQPLPAALAPQMSRGYERASGGAKPFELLEPAAAGGMTTSARDLARFMIAHLDPEGRGLMRPENLALMHRRASSPIPGREGFALGFFDQDRNGLRILGHDGDTLWFHSDLQLIPSERVGYFLGLNSAGNGRDVRRDLFRGFLDRWFPYAPPAEPTLPRARAGALEAAGWYETSRRNQTTLGLRRVPYQVRVRALPDGRLAIPLWGDAEGRSRLWRQVGPWTWREVGGQAHLSFTPGADGRPRAFINDDDTPIEMFQRVHSLQGKGALDLLIPAARIVLIAGLAAGFLGRRRRGLVDRLADVGAGAQLVVLAGWPALMKVMGGDLVLRMSGAADPWMLALYGASVVAVAGLVPQALKLVSAVRRGAGLEAAGATLMLAAGAWTAWLVFAFRLASFSLRY